MKNKDLTKTFWDKVSEVRIARGLTWDQLGDECGHTKQSLLAMKSMNKTPSFSFALDIVKALGVTIEDVTQETKTFAVQEGGLRDALYNLCSSLSDRELMVLIRTAEAFREADRMDEYDEDCEAVADVKRRYL